MQYSARLIILTSLLISVVLVFVLSMSQSLIGKSAYLGDVGVIKRNGKLNLTKTSISCPGISNFVIRDSKKRAIKNFSIFLEKLYDTKTVQVEFPLPGDLSYPAVFSLNEATINQCKAIPIICKPYFNVDQASGYEANCEVLNVKRGEGILKVVKTSYGGRGSFPFDTNTLIDSITTIKEGDLYNSYTGYRSEGLAPSNTRTKGMEYYIKEQIPPGWKLDSAKCDNGKIDNIKIVESKITTCSFENTKTDLGEPSK